MTGNVTLFGATYSVYVNIARLALAEKGVPYELIEIDIFAEDGPPADYLARQPFAKIPAFEHDGFQLFEAGAITHYVDEAFEGPALMPQDPKQRARVNQITSLLDSYAYRAMVWDVYVERVDVPASGGVSDEEKIAGGLETSEKTMTALEDLMGGNDYFTGSAVTLADLHAVPMFAAFCAAPEGAAALAKHTALTRWWERMSERESVKGIS